jgi:hypothetical protein
MVGRVVKKRFFAVVGCLIGHAEYLISGKLNACLPGMQTHKVWLFWRIALAGRIVPRDINSQRIADNL